MSQQNSEVAVQNTVPITHLQVGTRFRLRQSMEIAIDTTGETVTNTDDDHPL